MPLRCDFRMMLYGRILSVLSLSLRHVAVDDSGILTVRHHRQVQILSRLEDALQRLHLIHQHIAGAGAHEELDAWQWCISSWAKESTLSLVAP